MDFKRVRGKKVEARCKNVGTYGSPLYCDCGCQTPRRGDEPTPDSLLGLSARWTKNFQEYIGLFRGEDKVGMIDPGKQYIVLNNTEYLGVKKESALGALLTLPIGGSYEAISSAGSTTEETVAQEYAVEKIDLAEMDERHKNHPGYCNKCHGFCWGDCTAND